ALSTGRCAAIAGQAALCAGVGAAKVRANHWATAGWKAAGMARLKHSRSLTRSAAARKSHRVQSVMHLRAVCARAARAAGHSGPEGPDARKGSKVLDSFLEPKVSEDVGRGCSERGA